MASGPEHYQEAERLAEIAEQYLSDDADAMPFAHGMALAAQVHATLALAAAIAMGHRPAGGMDHLDFEAWDAVAGVQEDDDEDGEAAQWRRYDVSGVMQTAEIHTAPMPGDVPVNEDVPF